MTEVNTLLCTFNRLNYVALITKINQFARNRKRLFKISSPQSLVSLSPDKAACIRYTTIRATKSTSLSLLLQIKIEHTFGCLYIDQGSKLFFNGSESIIISDVSGDAASMIWITAENVSKYSQATNKLVATA